jgi:hypothetical protein
MAVRRAKAKPKAGSTIKAKASAKVAGGGGNSIHVKVPRSTVQSICRTGPRIIIITGDEC